MCIKDHVKKVGSCALTLEIIIDLGKGAGIRDVESLRKHCLRVTREFDVRMT